MEEREIITVGFGNYATLVAAQWANSTSHYDVQHKTLYRERTISHVLGGGGDGAVHEGFAGGQGKAVVRVPRLLLLDAPHPSDFKDLSEVQEEMDRREASHHPATGNEEAENEHHRGGGGLFADPVSASALLWQKPSSNARPPTAEERQLEKLAEFTSQRWRRKHLYRQRSYSSDDDEDDGKGESTGNEEEDGGDSESDYYVQLPRHRQGIEVEPAYATALSAEQGEEEEDKEESSAQHQQQHQQQHSRSYYKKRLFRSTDGTVPWWRYITTGLEVDSITTMRPPQHVDAAGEFPTLHNVGYGLSTFKSGNNAAGNADEAEALANALRRQLEDADGLQGLQCFIEGDSMFSGAAHNTLTEFWEDVGPKTPAVAFTMFSPLPAMLTDVEMAKSVPFAERRRDEVALNRLLCTSLLSQHGSALYVPIEIADWGKFFAGSRAATAGAGTSEDGTGPRSPSCWWLEDDSATAQYIAAVVDSVLYGARDGGGSGRKDAQGGPAFYLSEWTRTLRPMPSMRVSALLGSLPLPVPTYTREGKGGGQARPADLWAFLERTSLLPGSGSSDSGSGGPDDTRQPAPQRKGFVPMTHTFPLSPQAEAGRVVGHAVSLRGAGALPSTTYPAKEAMLRYALPLRTSTYLSLLTPTNMPISSTFPLSLLFDSAEAMRALEDQCNAAGSVSMRGAFADRGVDVGAHAVTSYQSAPMLGAIVEKAKAALRHKEHVHGASYSFEKDDWTERLEDVAEMYDDYRHEACDEADDTGSDGANEW